MPEELNEEVGLPDNWTPIESAPIIPGKTPPVYVARDIYQSGQLPSLLGLQPDLTHSGEQPAGIPTVRLMPVAPSGLAQVNAAIASAVKVGSVPGPPGPAGQNGLAGTGDGLVHGDPIWDIDTAYISYREDFKFFRNGSVGAAGAPVGDLAWTIAGSTGSLAANYQNGIFPHLGWVGWTNSSTADHCGFLYTSTLFDESSVAWPLFESPGWKMVFVFQFLADMSNQPAPDFTQKSVYVGLNGATDMSSTTVLGRPQIFAGLRYDTDPTSPAISDATFHFEVVENTATSSYTRDNTQGTVIDTGMTPKDQTWYRLEILCITAGVAIFSLYASDGTSSSAQTIAVPQYTLSSTSTVGKFASGLAFIPLGGAVAPWGSGSILNISNMTGSAAAMNGTRTAFLYSDAIDDAYFLLPSGAAISLTSSPYTIAGYPGFVPCMRMGNDSQSSPTGGSLTIWFDFWGFVWNSGLATAPLALAIGNSRWTAGS